MNTNHRDSILLSFIDGLQMLVRVPVCKRMYMNHTVCIAKYCLFSRYVIMSFVSVIDLNLHLESHWSMGGVLVNGIWICNCSSDSVNGLRLFSPSHQKDSYFIDPSADILFGSFRNLSLDVIAKINSILQCILQGTCSLIVYSDNIFFHFVYVCRNESLMQ